MSDLIGAWLRATDPLRFVPPAAGGGRPIVVQDPETGKYSNSSEPVALAVAYRLKITKIDGAFCTFNSQIKRTGASKWEPRSTGVVVPLDHMLDEIELGRLVRE